MIKVNKCDKSLLKERRWRIAANGYVYCSIKNHRVYLHRAIMKPGNGLVVDHINHIKTDNRRSNLRVATRGQNAANRKSFLGVTYDRRPAYRSKWRAYTKVNQKGIELGHFMTREEAVLAYNNAAKKFFGDFARLG